jgi:single-strand DNA-binding protein
MNNVTLIGRVGRQPELHYTSNGTAVCEISVAVDGTNDSVEWIPVVTWGPTAEAVAQHVQKGRQVGVEGELRVSEWQPDNGPKRYDVKVNARRVDFLAKPRHVDEPEPATASS